MVEVPSTFLNGFGDLHGITSRTALLWVTYPLLHKIGPLIIVIKERFRSKEFEMCRFCSIIPIQPRTGQRQYL